MSATRVKPPGTTLVPSRSRTTGLGRTPETFRTDPGVMRSAHPKTSFTAWGALADTIMADHKLEGGLGGGSPLQKLYDRNARVLFLGTGFRTCTAFHLGEWRAGKRPMIEDGAPVMVNGDRQWVTYEDMNYDEVPFTDMGADFEKSYTVAQAKVSWAALRLFSFRDAVDFAETALKRET